MENILDRLLSTKLADFEGLHIQATVPVSEDIANRVVAPMVQDFFSGKPAAAGADTEMVRLLKMLNATQFRLTFEKGKVVVQVELRR